MKRQSDPNTWAYGGIIELFAGIEHRGASCAA